MDGALRNGRSAVPGEPCPDCDLEHIDSRQQRRHQQHAEADDGQGLIGVHRRQSDVPLADKAGEGGDARQGAGRHRVAHEGHGHPLAQPLQLMDVLPVTVMQHGSGGEEGQDLHHGVNDEVQKGRRQRRKGHNGSGEEDVRQVRHRGVSQPPLEVPLLHRHTGGEQDGDKGQSHHRLLRPRPHQDLRAEGVVDQADAGEGTGFHHGHRMQECRHRGRRHRRSGQPCVQGPDGRLDAKAYKGQHEHRQQQLPIAGVARQMAAQCEVLRIVDNEKNQPDKGQRRPAHGVDGVLDAGLPGGGGHGLHHQRQRGQCQQLIEQIHGHHVPGEGHSQRHTEGDGEKRPEHGQMLLVAHVVEGVQHGEGPQGSGQPRKEPGSAVHPQGKGQLLREAQQLEALAAAAENGEPCRRRGQADQHPIEQMAAASAGEADQVRDKPAHQRQENGKRQIKSVHLPVPP